METYYNSTHEIISKNIEIGQHFFDKATMRFFNSRVLRTVYAGRYFITSESFDGSKQQTKYTIREAMPDGTIETVGEFQQYDTLYEAKKAVKQLLSQIEVK